MQKEYFTAILSLRAHQLTFITLELNLLDRLVFTYNLEVKSYVSQSYISTVQFLAINWQQIKLLV